MIVLTEAEVLRHHSGIDWAEQLLKRDKRRGVMALCAVVKWFQDNDGKSDDFGRTFVESDATEALTRLGVEQVSCPAGCKGGCDQCDGYGWVWRIPNNL